MRRTPLLRSSESTLLKTLLLWASDDDACLYAKLLGITANGLVIETEDRIRTVSFQHLDQLTVCQKQELPLLAGIGCN